jgi:hypothetical protein
MSRTTASVGEDLESDRLELVLVQQLGGAPEDEGRRILVDAPLLVGRDNPLFAERYPRLSRKHAELTPERDRIKVHDLGSRHGTYVQNKRVERGAVAPGDLLDLGGVGFIVARAPRLFVPAPHARLPHASHAFDRVITAAQAARKSRQPVAIVGEPGTGKSALADEIVDGGASAVVFDRLDELDAGAQKDLLLSLREAEEKPNAPRVIAISCVAPAVLVKKHALLPAIGAHLEGWVVTVPPLRERPEDVLPIVRATLQGFAQGERWEISPKLLARLVTDRWTGNVRALLAEVERLYLSAEDEVLVDREAAQAQAWRASGLRRVASDASWIEAPDGTRAQLGPRRVLRAVLTALLESHQRGEPLITARDLARLAWPGERMLPRAAANRVHVAITTLRKLGFGPSIENTGDGYRFAEAAVEIVPV